MKVYNNNQLYKLPAGDQLWNSGRQDWIFSGIGDQEGAISDPDVTRTVHALKSFLHFSLVVRNSYMHDIHCNSQTQQCMRGQCLHFLLSNIW